MSAEAKRRAMKMLLSQMRQERGKPKPPIVSPTDKPSAGVTITITPGVDTDHDATREPDNDADD